MLEVETNVNVVILTSRNAYICSAASRNQFSLVISILDDITGGKTHPSNPHSVRLSIV